MCSKHNGDVNSGFVIDIKPIWNLVPNSFRKSWKRLGKDKVNQLKNDLQILYVCNKTKTKVMTSLNDVVISFPEKSE